jgi:hypothetical protein
MRRDTEGIGYVLTEIISQHLSGVSEKIQERSQWEVSQTKLEPNSCRTQVYSDTATVTGSTMITVIHKKLLLLAVTIISVLYFKRNSDGLRSAQTGFDSRQCKTFLFSTSFRSALGPTQRPIQWVPQTLLPGIKRSGREADHSPPTSAEVKKMWLYTTTPPYAFMAQRLIT